MINSTERTWTTHLTRNGSVVGNIEDDSQRQAIPAVLIPGIGENVNSLRLLTSALHECGREVITVDTSRARGRLGYAALMGDYAHSLIEATAEQLGDRPIDVVGHSWGAYVASAVANHYPDRVNKVVLMAAYPGGGRLYPPSQSVQFEMMRPDYSQKRLEKVCGKLYGGDFRENPGLIETLGIAHDVDIKTYGRQVLAAVLMNFDDQIGKVKQKTLVMNGADDPITPYRNAQAICDRLPNSSLTIIKSAGHMFPMERAQETAVIINKFLKEA